MSAGYGRVWTCLQLPRFFANATQIFLFRASGRCKQRPWSLDISKGLQAPEMTGEDARPTLWRGRPRLRYRPGGTAYSQSASPRRRRRFYSPPIDPASRVPIVPVLKTLTSAVACDSLGVAGNGPLEFGDEPGCFSGIRADR